MFKINFNTDTSVFDDGPEFEIARILDKIANTVKDGCYASGIVDLNGNRIGEFIWEPDTK